MFFQKCHYKNILIYSQTQSIRNKVIGKSSMKDVCNSCIETVNY